MRYRPVRAMFAIAPVSRAIVSRTPVSTILSRRPTNAGMPQRIQLIGPPSHPVRGATLDPTKNPLTVLTDYLASNWHCIQRKGVDIVGRVIWIGARVA